MGNCDILKSRRSYLITSLAWEKGENKLYSDVDLAVASPDFGKDELKEIMILSKLSWKISDEIEAIPLSEKMLKLKYHPLIGEIKKYGITIYCS